MKLTNFKAGNINIDNIMYDLSVNYNAKVNDNEQIKFTSFKVYFSKDVNLYRFVVTGDYIARKKEKPFALCVEEMKESDYDTKYISEVFFNDRNTIVGLIHAVLNGYKIKDSNDDTEIELVEEINEELFDDTFVKEEIVIQEVIKEVDINKLEPVIILPTRRKSIKNMSAPAPKRKTKPKTSTNTTKKVVKK